MAIQISGAQGGGYITVNGVDLSNHAKNIVLNDGQETRDVTAHGNSVRNFRAGLGTVSIDAEFFNDHGVASVEVTLRPLVATSSTGFPVVVQKIAATATVPTSATNPKYTLTSILEGDLNVLSEDIGETGMLGAKFLPYSGTLTVSTSATS